ncbi:cytochrome c biogenesis protein CcdA [Marinilabiliaceae bacterium ANBcel2]|nr:cytochrome c biogenesis protein CcdA [Marinilabiliaceae bacterium ANBcel2]
MRQLFFLIVILLFSTPFISYSQVEDPVKWEFSYTVIDEARIKVFAKAEIEQPWNIYSTNVDPGGPIPTSFVIEEDDSYDVVDGSLKQDPEPVPSYDEAFQMEVGYFNDKVVLSKEVVIRGEQPLHVKGYVEYMACDDHRCLPPQAVDFNIEVADSGSVEKISDSDSTDKSTDYSGIFLIAFIGGLAALLTPCVFPMIPLTVSFFIRNAGNRTKAIKDGLMYGGTIIFAYVVLGLLISVLFGANALNTMATSPAFNLFFFILLIFFAASFFGAFELQMPSKWSNSLDERADKSRGLTGVFLMGLTFVLVSFSCTGPIVGTLLVEAAIGGSMFSPAVGMLGFSIALAIPFTLFAIFPTAMKSLPKSGGWMNSVKVVLGFIVVAFSLKFLSVADAVAQWGILDREVFISLWIAIFLLLGLYLIGKIKFSHDSDLPYISVPRLGLSIVVFAFVFYLIPGLWGAPLKAVSSFLPSPVTQDFDLSRMQVSSDVRSAGVDNVADGVSVIEGPHGLMKYTDYDEGLEAAKEAGKPIFLDFTGLGCANCRKMESMVWSDDNVRHLLANDFIIISLYVDNRENLPDSEQYVSDVTDRRVRTVGNKWSDFQISRYGVNSQPFYVLLDHKENKLNEPRGYNTNVEAYVNWLREGIENF